jgi:Transposase DDE domain group 1
MGLCSRNWTAGLPGFRAVCICMDQVLDSRFRGNHLFTVMPTSAYARAGTGGQTIRADFEGGALSSDFRALWLRGIDHQIGLTERLAAVIRDKRHQSSIDHPWRALLAQRIYQSAAGDADANDAKSLRRDPLCKLGVERAPFDPIQD